MSKNIRNLQKISGSYFVSLPKNWVENYGLDKHSSIFIDINTDGTLMLTPKLKQEEIQDELILEAKQSVSREIVKNSLSGIERIVVISEKEINKDIKDEIKLFVDGLPNTDIIEESSQRIVIQTFSYKKIPTKKLIHRLLYLVCDMFENLRERQYKDLNRNFSQLRKFYFILVSHIRTYLRTGIYISEEKDFNPLEAMDFRMFCQKISKIGEILKDLRLSDKTTDFFQKIETYYTEVMNAFLKKDNYLAFELWFKRDKFIQDSKNLLNKLDYEDIDRIKEMVMIAHSCKDMAALI